MKRVFALLCVLALVLPMICTGAAAVEPENQQQYVFEKMPDVMYLDETFVFPFFEGDAFLGDCFICDDVIPEGSYYFEFLADGESVRSCAPTLLEFVPYDDPDVGVMYSCYLSIASIDFDLGGFIYTYELAILIITDIPAFNGTYVVVSFVSGDGEGIAPTNLILTRVDDPDDTIITVDGSGFSDFSYSNLSIIMLCGLGLSAGPALFWFAYRVIKKKVSRAFFNGKL